MQKSQTFIPLFEITVQPIVFRAELRTANNGHRVLALREMEMGEPGPTVASWALANNDLPLPDIREVMNAARSYVAEYVYDVEYVPAD